MKKNNYPQYSLHGDRRLRFERRQFNYSNYFPERRTGKDRRLTASLFNSYKPLVLQAEARRF